jgi:hypothetical protein
MAEQSQVTKADRKAELVSELAWSRAELTRSLLDTRSDLNLVAGIKHSIVHRKTAWFTGAAVTGWILSRLPGRKKKQPLVKALHISNSRETQGRAAFWLSLLATVANLLKPFLTALASRKINEMAARSGEGRHKWLR